MGFFNKFGSGGVRAFGAGILLKLAAFIDTFTTTDSASALPQSSGKWVPTSGTWGISTNRAYSTTAASSYPVATIDANTPTAVVKSVNTTSTTAGTGVSYWVTDASNWWGAYTEKTSFAAAPYSCPSGGTLYGSTCQINQPAGGGPYGVTTCPGGGNPFGWGCFNCCWVYSYAASYYVQPAGYNCNAYPGYSLSGGTCYTQYGGSASTWYRHQLKTIKKSAGTVTVVATTEVANTLTNTDYVAYVQANTQASSAIITAAMNTGGAVASYTAPAGTPVPANRHGMIVGPATLNQSSLIDSFEYTPN